MRPTTTTHSPPAAAPPPTVTPIETAYGGCQFRSRLEARWAIVFDHLGLTWHYEPDCYELVPVPAPDWSPPRRPGRLHHDEHGGWYLPDFHLDGIGYFEVKGTDPGHAGWDRLWRFGELVDERFHIAVGPIPDPSTLDLIGHPVPWGPREFDIHVAGDHHYALCTCRHCDRVGIEFDARGARICRHDSDDKAYSGDDPRIVEGYRAARSARFGRRDAR